MGLPNAFALLQQSGKRKPTEPSPRDGASANKKQKFSAVDKNLSVSTVLIHLFASRVSMKPNDVSASLLCALQESSFEDCPLCNNKVPRALLNFHINGCLDGILGDSSGTDAANQTFAQSTLELSQPASEGPSNPTQTGKSPLAPHPADGTAGNAFAHMMQKQRERSQTWSFFLGRHPDGAYYWHIWRDKHLAADAKASGKQALPLY